MVRRPAAAQPKVAILSPRQRAEAITKIDRRLSELASFDPDTVQDRSDPRIGALEGKLDALLVGIFGPDTVEYARYHWDVGQLDTASYNTFGTPLSEVRLGLQQGLARSAATLGEIKAGFLEDLEDAGQGVVSRPLQAYAGLDLHPAIERASGQLFRDGHYANAIEDAVKALNALVRLNSGIEDRDGSSLMEFVFSPKAPVLRFNALADQSDQDEQKGFMMMFSGAVAGLRNPRAHKLIKDDAERALEFIAFVSLLAKLADKSTRT